MLTLEQQKRLAEIVYPGQQVLERDFGVVVRPIHGENNLPDMFRFNPSLTGEDWQVAQACRVIVAASKLPEAIYEQCSGEYKITFDEPDGDFESSGWQPDLLSASIAALLSQGGGK